MQIFNAEFDNKTERELEKIIAKGKSYLCYIGNIKELSDLDKLTLTAKVGDYCRYDKNPQLKQDYGFEITCPICYIGNGIWKEFRTPDIPNYASGYTIIYQAPYEVESEIKIKN